MADPILLPHELESSAWKKIKTHLQAELVERREYNDAQSLDVVGTAVIRGEIKMIKRILRIEKKAGE